MEDVKVLRIAELVNRGLPLTGSSTLHLRTLASSRPSVSKKGPRSSTPSCGSDSNPSPKVLTPLNYPTVIVGTIALPEASRTSASHSFRCCYNNCFRFSDGSAVICCDILDLDIGILGKEIRVLAWNFLPLRGGGGFIEVIKWCLPQSAAVRVAQCSRSDVFPLASCSAPAAEDSSKARYRLFGRLNSVGPVSTMPCAPRVDNSKSKTDSVSGGTGSLRGFLVQVMVCECKLCHSKELTESSITSFQEQDNHSFSKPEFVYFCGSASSWHPVIVKFTARIVEFFNLKKKLVIIGEEEPFLLYVIAEKSALRLAEFPKKWVPLPETTIKGQGECSSYSGVIKGVYMQGMVIELDNEVWLLLTDHLLTPPHSLRVGSVIAVRNVHLVNPGFSWSKMLILGACAKTSISVKSFSPLETGCHIIQQSNSTLGKFVESLPFSARLWVLHIVSSFRKKFAGMLSEKEILGSKHKEGLAQTYANSHLASSSMQPRRGVLMELYKHDSCCGCANEHSISKLNPIAPVSCFVHHFVVFWTRKLLFKNYGDVKREDNQFNITNCKGRTFCQTVRKLYHSEEIGIILVGTLKFCPHSGRLQLADATGSINAIVPDLPLTMNFKLVYEITTYTLVIEGPPQLGNVGSVRNKTFSFRNIFHPITTASDLELDIHVIFHLRNATCRILPFFSCINSGNVFEKPEKGTFHILRIIHKFPMLQKFQGDSVLSNSSGAFVEAIVCSWNLFLAGKGENMNSGKSSTKQDKEEAAGGSFWENGSQKRRRIDPSSQSTSNSLDFNDCGCGFLAVSDYYQGYCDKHENYDKVRCLANVKGVDCESQRIPGFLFIAKGKSSTCSCIGGDRKVMLEFEPQISFKYQLLQIGNYYITRHSEDCICDLKNSNGVGHLKVAVTSSTSMWSISFFYDGHLSDDHASHFTEADNRSFQKSEVPSETKTGIHLETCCDVYLHIPANFTSLFGVGFEQPEEGSVNQIMEPHGYGDIFKTCRPLVTTPVVSSGSPHSNCQFPEGNLISLKGHVVAVHYLTGSTINAYERSQNLRDDCQGSFFPGGKYNYCIHLLVNNNLVRISGSTGKHLFPSGFGPGVFATFHRILELGGQRGFMITPVSFIVLNSIGVSGDSYYDEIERSTPDKHDIPFRDTLSSGLISEMIDCLNSKAMKLRSRIVAVNIMILEKLRNRVESLSEASSRSPHIHIPLASFVLDDGSATCCCWTSGENASTLLRLHELLPQRVSESIVRPGNWDGIGHKTSIRHLQRVFSNHDRITVKSCGSMLDSSYQDLEVSLCSDCSLSSTDENLIKFIVLHACSGPSWTVAGNMMDSNAARSLLKDFMAEMEAVRSIPNIWVTEVSRTNTLIDARNIIRELVDR